MAIKNPMIKAQFTKFIEAEGLNGHKEDSLFEMFSIFAVEQGLLNRNIEYTDIHFSGSEFGIDGAAIIVNDELITDTSQLAEVSPMRSVEFHFFQSKSGEKCKSGDIGNFFSAIEDFFDGDFESTSEDLSSLHSITQYIYENSSELVESPNLKIFFVTTGKYESPKPIEKLISNAKRNLTSTVLFGDNFL